MKAQTSSIELTSLYGFWIGINRPNFRRFEPPWKKERKHSRTTSQLQNRTRLQICFRIKVIIKQWEVILISRQPYGALRIYFLISQQLDRYPIFPVLLHSFASSDLIKWFEHIIVLVSCWNFPNEFALLFDIGSHSSLHVEHFCGCWTVFIWFFIC